MFEARVIGGRMALFGASTPYRDPIPDEAFHTIEEWQHLLAEGEQIQRQQRLGFTENFTDRIWAKHHRRDAERAGRKPEAPRHQRDEGNPQSKAVDADAIYKRWNGTKK